MMCLRISFYQKQLNNDMCMSMRLIDWNRGKTCIWRREDYEELMSSDMIFATKFCADIDKEIVFPLRNNI